jgi:hypothetical protein
MPSCNLTESMHHKWNQQSSNRGSDLYIAIVNDFIRALMQVVRYNQYLKGGRAGTEPGKEELQLRACSQPFLWGWLLCERGAGSGERGTGISYFNI